MTRRNPHDLATTAHTNTTIIATLITQTIHRLQQETGGYPTHTPGAAIAGVGPIQDCRPCLTLERVQMRPCPIHDADELGPDTPVERLASQHDPAAHDHERLATLLRKLDQVASEAAGICTRWGNVGLNDSDVSKKLADIDSLIWCAHCSQFGNHEPRSPGERHCRVCADYKREYGDLPTKAIWAARDSRGGKLYVQDITRIRARENADRRARKKSA